MTHLFLTLAVIVGSAGALGCFSLLRMAGGCSRTEEMFEQQTAIG
ncbi:MAG: hypothetical protein V4636_01120 [Pseudomonadota bacterium]